MSLPHILSGMNMCNWRKGVKEKRGKRQLQGNLILHQVILTSPGVVGYIQGVRQTRFKTGRQRGIEKEIEGLKDLVGIVCTYSKVTKRTIVLFQEGGKDGVLK